MTTIIGIEYQDRSVIMTDNRVTNDGGKVWHHPDMVKLTKRGAFIIAGAGEIVPCDVIQHIWEPPRVMAKDKEDLWHFMIVKVIPSMRKCLIENGYNFNEPDAGDNRFGFIVSVAGHLFELDDDLGVTRQLTGLYGIGSGGDIALGALSAGASPEQAMDIAAQLTAFTAGPYLTETHYK